MKNSNSYLVPFLLALALGWSCASSKKAVSTKTAALSSASKSITQADPRATELIIQGALAETQGDYPSALIAYQQAHHRQKTFQEEYIEFLKKYNIEYDERYVWD